MSIGMTAVVGAGEFHPKPALQFARANGLLPEYCFGMASIKDQQAALHRLSNMLKVRTMYPIPVFPSNIPPACLRTTPPLPACHQPRQSDLRIPIPPHLLAPTVPKILLLYTPRSDHWCHRMGRVWHHLHVRPCHDLLGYQSRWAMYERGTSLLVNEHHRHCD
jgi:hypothetical protein